MTVILPSTSVPVTASCFNDWISVHLDFRDYIFDSDLLGTDKTTHNLEATTGLSFFF